MNAACEDRRAMDSMSTPPTESLSPLHQRVMDWFGEAARDLPWRASGDQLPDPWAVMVSEFMLQQTPVVRVRPVFEEWMRRWPRPADLAQAASGEAIRAWGRLGYPRRAIRLHAAALAITADHDGRVPNSYQELVALPGVGDYTAAAIVSFAFGGRAVVLDTNVRRVLVRVAAGEQFPNKSVTAAERALATRLLPDEHAHVWAAATMELGALICTAASPRCEICPVSGLCAWRANGYPAHDGPARQGQSWNGTDRQCRGRLLGAVRDAPGPVPKSALDLVWPEAEQRERCLDALLDDRLLDIAPDGSFLLPG